MSLNDIRNTVHRTAIEKGWWDEPRSFGDMIALCHSELSEALEEYRNNYSPNDIYFKGDKPEGVPTELADVIIRILDMAGWYEIDIDEAVGEKMLYNRTRPYRHGGKVM